MRLVHTGNGIYSNPHLDLVNEYSCVGIDGTQKLWVPPENAREAGKAIGGALFALCQQDTSFTLTKAAELLDDPVMPAERKVKVMHGVIDALAEVDGFGSNGNSEVSASRIALAEGAAL